MAGFVQGIQKDQANRGVTHYPRGVPIGDKGMSGRGIPALPDVRIRTHTVCVEKTKTGEPCKAKPNAESGLCFSHGRKKDS